MEPEVAELTKSPSNIHVLARLRGEGIDIPDSRVKGLGAGVSTSSQGSGLPQDTQHSHVLDSGTGSTYEDRMSGRSQYAQPSQGSGSGSVCEDSHELSDPSGRLRHDIEFSSLGSTPRYGGGGNSQGAEGWSPGVTGLRGSLGMGQTSDNLSQGGASVFGDGLGAPSQFLDSTSRHHDGSVGHSMLRDSQHRGGSLPYFPVAYTDYRCVSRHDILLVRTDLVRRRLHLSWLACSFSRASQALVHLTLWVVCP